MNNMTIALSRKTVEELLALIGQQFGHARSGRANIVLTGDRDGVTISAPWFKQVICHPKSWDCMEDNEEVKRKILTLGVALYPTPGQLAEIGTHLLNWLASEPESHERFRFGFSEAEDGTVEVTVQVFKKMGKVQGRFHLGTDLMSTRRELLDRD